MQYRESKNAKWICEKMPENSGQTGRSKPTAANHILESFYALSTVMLPFFGSLSIRQLQSPFSCRLNTSSISHVEQSDDARASFGVVT